MLEYEWLKTLKKLYPSHARAWRRPTLVLAAAAVTLASGFLAVAQNETIVRAAGPIIRIEIDSIIHVVVKEIIDEGIAEAERLGAQALIVELNTPGGVLQDTRAIATSFLEADVPIVVFVSPQGSRAASAGFFLLMAADVAAMAPGTNTGAAHPVGGTGQDIPGKMGDKVEEDTAAWIRSLAAQHGRSEEHAEAAVLESKSYSANESLELGLIDFVADDLDALLAELEGFVVTKNDRSVSLQPRSARIETLEMTPFQRARSVIVTPNVALALASIGGIAIMLELYSPGAILPGVVGAICLILAGYSMTILPTNWTGVALILLGIVLLSLEIKIPSFGVLTAGGIVSFVLGGLFLFKSPDPALRVSLQMIVAVAVVSAALVILLMTTVLRVHKTKVQTGREGLLLEKGVARTAIDPRGKVEVHGEIWNAESGSAIEAGAEIEVEAVDGMTLKIKPIQT